MTKTALSTLLQDYLEYLEVERGRSAKTVENYHRYLKRFFTWAKTKSPEDITSEKVRKYRVWLNRLTDEKGRTLKKVTQNYYVIALRGFLKHLAKRGIESLPAEQIELGKQEEREVSFLEWEEIERLLKAPLQRGSGQAEGDGLIAFRDRTILELLFSTGLRVSELCGLDRDDVDIKKGEFPVRGKGGKIRIVFLSDEATQAIKDYLEKRTDVDPALFIRIGRGGPRNVETSKYRRKSSDLRLTPRQVQRLIKKYAAKAGIMNANVTPHTMRHSYATNLLRNGADIRSVQALLGHSSITTTQIYTHVTDKALREIYKKYHGRKK